MILWNVKNGEREFDLDVGDCTILVGQDVVWYELVRLLDDYFNTRASTVQIEEDMNSIQKKDWNCYFIPFDAQLQMDKITTKSPLNEIINDCIEQLSTTPAFFELKETWEELQEETFFVNESLGKYEIKAVINDFNESDLKSFITLESSKPLMGPVEYKFLLLRLIAEQSVDKKTLIIIELPELFSGAESVMELERMVNKMRQRGIRFIIVTGSPVFHGRKNYCIDNQIVNDASVEQIKRKVLLDAPFGAEDEQFEMAKNKFFMAVDNSSGMGGIDGFPTHSDDAIQVLTHMIVKSLNINQTLDTKGFPSNISEFIAQY